MLNIIWKKAGITLAAALVVAVVVLTACWLIGWRNGTRLSEVMNWLGIIAVLFAAGSLILRTSFGNDPRYKSGMMLMQQTYSAAGTSKPAPKPVAASMDWLFYMLAAAFFFGIAFLLQLFIK